MRKSFASLWLFSFVSQEYVVFISLIDRWVLRSAIILLVILTGRSWDGYCRCRSWSELSMPLSSQRTLHSPINTSSEINESFKVRQVRTQYIVRSTYDENVKMQLMLVCMRSTSDSWSPLLVNLDRKLVPMHDSSETFPRQQQEYLRRHIIDIE